MKAHGCTCQMWLSSLAWQAGTFRDAEGSWWMVFITHEFAKIHHCPFCGQQLAYDAEQGFDDLDDWNPAAVKTKVEPVNIAQQAKVAICQHAVKGKYMCLKDGLLCQGQCGVTTDQAC